MSTTVANEVPDATQPVELEKRIKTILAQTDWEKYWEDVAAAVEPEIEAYEIACAKSMASASRKFVR